MTLDRSRNETETRAGLLDRRTIENHCGWTSDEDGVYHTDCGHAFLFVDSGPREYGMTFCCYCGDRLQADPSGANAEGRE